MEGFAERKGLKAAPTTDDLDGGVLVEVLLTSPVKTTGVPTPDLAGWAQKDKLRACVRRQTVPTPDVRARDRMTIVGNVPYTVGSHHDRNFTDTCCSKGD